MIDRKSTEGRRIETLQRLSEKWPELAKARVALAVRFCEHRKAQIHQRMADPYFHPLQNRSGSERTQVSLTTT